LSIKLYKFTFYLLPVKHRRKIREFVNAHYIITHIHVDLQKPLLVNWRWI